MSNRTARAALPSSVIVSAPLSRLPYTSTSAPCAS